VRRQRRNGVRDPDALLASGELLPLATAGFVVVDAREAELVHRLFPLQRRMNAGTVTVVIIDVPRRR
jgi:hypothetical protein